jgi:hypothetical protein
MSQRFSLAAGLIPHGRLDITQRARKYKRLRSPGIDSKESTLPAYVAWWASTSDRVVVPARQAGNRFLGLQITNTGSGIGLATEEPSAMSYLFDEP